MAKIYGIISGKGGVGKTTSTINIAAALNILGADAMIVDANFSTPNIGLHLGAPIVPLTMNHVLDEKADVRAAVYEHESGLKVLISSLAMQKIENIKHEKLVGLGKQLRRLSDYVILDSAAGLGKETESVIKAADELILITHAEMPSVTDALKTIKLAEQLGKEVRGFIITRRKNKRTEMPIDNIKDMLEIPLLGIVPEDRKMQKALYLKDAIVHTHPRSKSARAYKKIAQKLLED